MFSSIINQPLTPVLLQFLTIDWSSKTERADTSLHSTRGPLPGNTGKHKAKRGAQASPPLPVGAWTQGYIIFWGCILNLNKIL